MGLTHYDEFRKGRSGLVRALIIWNAAVALVVAFLWSGVSDILSEPFRWAMRSGVSMNPAWTEYPYILLWLTPLLATVGSWLALKAEQLRVAKLIGLYPNLTLGLMIGWYYLAPTQWH